MRLFSLQILFEPPPRPPAVSDSDFWPLCFECGAPVNPVVGWVRYDDGRIYHRACDEKALGQSPEY